MDKKQAGLERPYTVAEFVSIIEKMAKEQHIKMMDELDYFSPMNRENILNDGDTYIISLTKFGSSEGIYTHFYIYNYNGEDIMIALAKHLGEDDETFVQMHEFSARITLMMNKYIFKHSEEFEWKNYSIGHMAHDRVIWDWYCAESKCENHITEMLESCEEVIVRNNATREITIRRKL